jgi:small-conductance mechanosensitive channel
MISMKKETKKYLIIVIVILIILGFLFLNMVTVIIWIVGLLILYGFLKDVYESNKEFRKEMKKDLV